jgi:hypothetical protein
MTKYKYPLIFGAVFFFVLFAGIYYKKIQYDKQVKLLSDQLAQTQQLVQTTKDSWSSAATEANNLKVQDSDLEKQIKASKDKILALTNLSLQLKSELFDIRNATETVVNQARNSTFKRSCGL